ncbi:hypothetical protein ACFU99_01095 [Streptomyces sp. NPDC057654]|uniref:hypothetical protein n=1 Tax=Streptomyces sp. NPDC057654 TaxID=3346196 RepID=UPI0036CBC0CD
MKGETVAQFATGMARTTVTRTATGFRWIRRPGTDVRADPQHQPGPVPADFTQRASAASSDHFTFAVPETWHNEAYTWNAPGPRSAAQSLLDGTPHDPDASARIARTYGRHLRTFHGVGIAAGTAYPAPRYPTRLADWIRTAAGTRAAPAFHSILRDGLGTQRWSKLTAYAHEATSRSGHLTVVIGWATLGSLITVDAPQATRPVAGAALLCGPEGALAAPEVDLGCVLGELHEIAAAHTARDLPGRLVTTWRDALLNGYGTPLDTARTARTAVVRIAAHAHDFAAYVGFHSELHTYVGMLADLLDDEGTQTLARET